jgi:hypothetical protein
MPGLSHRSLPNHPRPDSERDVEKCNGEERMRKHACNRYGHEYQGNKNPAVKYRTGSELSAAGTAAEQVEPTNNGNRHANNPKERLLVANKISIHQERLDRTWPNNEQGSGPKIEEASHRSVL